MDPIKYNVVGGTDWIACKRPPNTSSDHQHSRDPPQRRGFPSTGVPIQALSIYVLHCPCIYLGFSRVVWESIRSTRTFGACVRVRGSDMQVGSAQVRCGTQWAPPCGQHRRHSRRRQGSRLVCVRVRMRVHGSKESQPEKNFGMPDPVFSYIVDHIREPVRLFLVGYQHEGCAGGKCVHGYLLGTRPRASLCSRSAAARSGDPMGYVYSIERSLNFAHPLLYSPNITASLSSGNSERKRWRSTPTPRRWLSVQTKGHFWAGSSKHWGPKRPSKWVSSRDILLCVSGWL